MAYFPLMRHEPHKDDTFDSASLPQERAEGGIHFTKPFPSNGRKKLMRRISEEGRWVGSAIQKLVRENSQTAWRSHKPILRKQANN
jgi:hypothetical protein